MAEKLLLTPPLAFLIILAFSFLLAGLAGRLSYRPRKHSAAEGKAYACGEDTYNPKARPDYSSFFSFAFFFTLAHVATLIVTTVPLQDLKTTAIVFVYVAGGATGLYMLFRRSV